VGGRSCGNGWPQLKFVSFSIGSGYDGSDGSKAYYDQDGNRFFLASDDGSTWIGRKSPGSAGIIENSRVILNMADTVVSAITDTLTIDWSVTFKETVGGEKGVFMNVWDDYNAKSGWQQMGTWTITGGGGSKTEASEPGRILLPVEEQLADEELWVPLLEPVDEEPADEELELPILEPLDEEVGRWRD